MPNRAPDPCYLCARFRRHEEAPPGHGYCDGFERIVRHDDRACVLFKRARDEAKRKAWAEQQPKETT